VQLAVAFGRTSQGVQSVPHELMSLFGRQVLPPQA
jgi:hypothetical protein